MTSTAESPAASRPAPVAAVDASAGGSVETVGRLSDQRVDVVIPVYNEAHILAANVHTLHDFLTSSLPVAWRIIIADNASNDATWLVADRLQGSLPHVSAVHLDRKGRGLALKAVWSASSATVLTYMDVDLSTALTGFLPLIAPVLSGHSEISIGSRLRPGSRVQREWQREVLSRSYNIIVRATLAAQFRDAQCGFKAISQRAARCLLPFVRDDGWFFDTELLLLAQRAGVRVFEVPVDWVEDRDSRVNVPKTVKDDLRGIWRLRRSFWSGSPARSALQVGPASVISGSEQINVSD